MVANQASEICLAYAFVSPEAFFICEETVMYEFNQCVQQFCH